MRLACSLRRPHVSSSPARATKTLGIAATAPAGRRRPLRGRTKRGTSRRRSRLRPGSAQRQRRRLAQPGHRGRPRADGQRPDPHARARGSSMSGCALQECDARSRHAAHKQPVEHRARSCAPGSSSSRHRPIRMTGPRRRKRCGAALHIGTHTGRIY